MSRLPISICFCLLTTFLLAAEPARPSPELKVIEATASPANVAVMEKWAKNSEKLFDFDYAKQPLKQVIDDIGRKVELKIVMEDWQLTDVGVAPDKPVSFAADALSAREALRHILDELGLTYEFRFGQMRVTGNEKGFDVMRYYVLTGQSEREPSDWKDESDVSDWADLVEGVVRQDMWSNVGGPSNVRRVNRNAEGSSAKAETILVRSNWETHQQVEAFLRGIVRVQKEFQADPRKVTSPSIDVSGIDAIRRALEKPDERVFDSTLHGFAEHMSALVARPVMLSRSRLADVTVSGDTKIAGGYEQVPLGEGLSGLLNQHGITYYPTQNGLVITTREDAEKSAHMSLRIFPVYDLLPAERERQQLKMEQLADLIQRTIQPEIWNDVGGPAPIQTIFDPPMVIISAPLPVITGVERFLDGLRQSQAAVPTVAPQDPPGDGYQRQVFRLGTTALKTDDKAGTTWIKNDLPDEEVKSLVVFLQRNVARDSWTDKEVQMDVWKNRLYVRQRRTVLTEIKETLRRLSIEDHNATDGKGGTFCGNTVPRHVVDWTD